MKDFSKIPSILPACSTVGELVDLLCTLPADLDIRGEWSEGVKPVIFNRKTSPFLRLEDDDGTWNEGDSAPTDSEV